MTRISPMKTAGCYGAALALALLSSIIFFPGDWRAIACLSILGAGAATWTVFFKTLAAHLERAFLAIAIPTLAILVIAMPVTASVSWDGQIHFDAARALAHPFGSTYTEADELMQDSDSIYELGLYPFGTSEDDWTPNWSTILGKEAYDHSIGVLDQASMNQIEDALPAFTRINGADIFNVNNFCRIPNAIGLFAGSLLGLPDVATYYLGRATGAAFYILVMFLAIKNLRSGKALLLVVALIPTTLFMAANYSYDPTAIAFIAYGTTRFVRLLQKKDARVDAKEAALILIPFVLGIFTKAVLFPALALLFCLPKRCFSSRRSRILWNSAVACSMIVVLASFALPFLISSGTVFDDTRGTSNVSATHQIAFVLSHPLDFIETLTRWAIIYLYPSNLAYAAVNLCYLPAPAGWFVASAIEWILLIVAAVIVRTPEHTLGYTRRIRLVSVCAIAAAYLLMATSLYLSFTQVGGYNILGMQPRYILVLLYPLLATACFSRKLDASGRITKAIRSKATNAIVALECVLCTYLVLFGFILNF